MAKTSTSNALVESAREMAARWGGSPKDSAGDFLLLRDLLTLLSRELYSDFSSTGALPSFDNRLTDWLNSAKTETQRKTMYQFVPWLVFAAQREMDALSLAAYRGPILRWLIDTADIKLDSANLDAEIASVLRKTYFASLAGYNVEGFCRYNRVPRRDTTGNLRAWVAEGAADANSYASKRKMLADEGFEYLIVVEDFIGSGTQLNQAESAIKEIDNVKLLICPFCCAPLGERAGHQLAARYPGRVTFEPMFSLPTTALLRDSQLDPHEPKPLERMRKVVKAIAPLMPEIPEPFGLFGTGSLFLMNTNCPDNVPPLVWHANPLWKPLFPRQHRGT